ncbi:MAG: TonB-dependent receptor domain-containing protein, partial [Blastocatellia bacterium]
MIPGAQVMVTNVQTRINRTTQTNNEGNYNLPYLPPGQYDVVVESPGFNKARVVEVRLTVGLVATINVTLAAGNVVTDAVTITANAAQLERQNASLGTVVESQQIIDLPLLGRNPYDLVTLAPGVIDRGGSGSGPIINGGRSNTSEILFDGAETRNSTTNDIGYRPPLETVQEFKVITNGMAAEFGRTGGGVVTAASRSGTNNLHGSFYEFLRNDKLNANSWASNRVGLPRNAFRRNEYGFSVGGPVYVPRVYDGRNKTFFFVNWEQVKQRAPDNIVVTVPTALQRAGDFSQTVDGRGTLIRIFDPLTTRPDPAQAGRFIRDQFSCNGRLNVICPARIDPIAARIMQFYPLPNRSTLTQNFVRNGSRRNDSTNLFLKFDQNLGARHHLFVTYGRTENPRFTPGINEAFPGEGTNGERGEINSHNRTAVISDTVTFRSNLIGEFRANIARTRAETLPRSVGFDFTRLGIGQAVKDRAGALLFPRFDVTDVEALGPDRASYFNDAQYSAEVQGHLTWQQGAHSVKTGGNFSFMAFNVFRPERPAGLYQFGRGFTQGPNPATASATAGFGVATFLLGAPTGGQISVDPTLAGSQKYHALYLQDDWKVRRSLTLNLGLRWEYQTPWTDRFNQLAFFDPDFTEPGTGRKGVLRFVGRDGNSRYQSDPDKNNFAPRVGLAWLLLKDTVVRVNYGLNYFPGSGGIGAGASDLGAGFLATTGIFLGQPPAAPNTPPVGASLVNPFLAGFLPSPTTAAGG